MELDDLDKAVQRANAEQASADKLSQARCKLIVGRDAKSAFFATVALRLKPVQDWSIETAATDGKALKYNPSFIADMPLDELMGVVTHECLHVTNAHHARLGDRDMQQWNVACDLAINPLVKECGYKLPKGALFPGQGPFAKLQPGLSAEEYYDQLPQRKQGQDPEGDYPGGGDPGGTGGVLPPPDDSPAGRKQAEHEGKILAKQAETAAKQRGDMPGGLARNTAEATAPPKVDWRAVLREFVSAAARNDYSWMRPNRRFIGQGLYLPGLHSEELGEIAVAVDVSGSIDDAMLATFAKELQGILDSYACTMTVLYHDAAICRVQEHSSTDGPLVLESCGGGGTCHRPVFDYVEEHHLEPVCMVALTDLCSTFPRQEPGYPVLWATVCPGTVGPFGRTVEVE